MLSWLAKLAATLWRSSRLYSRLSKDEGDGDDALLWSRDIVPHAAGEYSFAVAQANEPIEDHSQVETGRDATFVGVYDGHGGPDASRFIADHLFLHLMRHVRESGTLSEDVVRNAFAATEDGFLAHVRRTRQIKPLIAAVGSCCLVGIIWNGNLYTANLGDSRAVIGCLDRSNNIIAEQLTEEHNASIADVRQELMSLHPDDSHIVVLKQGVWRIKGLIQVSRTIGDAYLKRPEITIGPSFPRFHLPEPLARPVLSSEPSICTRVLRPQDRFAIFASDGLWEHLTNQEAAEIVHNHPRAGIARRLIRSALQAAARKREMRYADLKKIEKGVRRFFHDDITVVVVFIDREHLLVPGNAPPPLSVRGFVDVAGPSEFSMLDGI